MKGQTANGGRGVAPNEHALAHLIAREQLKYPDVKPPPPYAATEWLSEDVGVYFDTRGLLKPKRYTVPSTVKEIETRNRQLTERMERKEKELAELRGELGMGGYRVISPDQVMKLQQHLAAATDVLMGPYAKLPPKIQKTVDSAVEHLSESLLLLGADVKPHSPGEISHAHVVLPLPPPPPPHTHTHRPHPPHPPHTPPPHPSFVAK